MKKLIQGIVKFRQDVRPDYRERFARLALGQAPDTREIMGMLGIERMPEVISVAEIRDWYVVR